MAATIYLPTDCFNEIKGFLLFKKDERRRPPHFTAMNHLINKATAPFIERPALYRGAERALNGFINKPAGDDNMNSDEWWDLHALMEWYDDDYLFNNNATLYGISVDRAAFYITYIVKAALLNSAPPPPRRRVIKALK